MKTSKITVIHKASPKKEGYPNRFYDLTLENGDEINILKKDGTKEGDVVNYELTGADDGQQRFKKAKSVQPMTQSPSQGKYEPKDSGVITMLSCISSACNAVAQSSDYKNYHVISDLAIKFFDLANSKSSLK